MILYLTSSFVPYKDPVAQKMIKPMEFYGFFDDLKKEWPGNAKMLFVPGNPDAASENEEQMRYLLDAFRPAQLHVEDVKVLDAESDTEELVKWADVVYLAGGHAPSQLSFMKRKGLKDALRGYEGIVIGVGAGSINSAFYVYHIPELAGEATDPNYSRFSNGLDLTNIQIIPHWEYIPEKNPDGLDFVKDIILPDSFGCRFYMISDGSYFKVKGGRTTFKGRGEIIEDGTVRPLKEGAIVPFMSYVEQPVIRSLISEGYDMVFTVEKHDEHCEVYHLKDRISGMLEKSRLSYNDICFMIAQDVVDEERDEFLVEIKLPLIIKEMADKGNYVRTIHVNTAGGRRAKNIRAKEVPGYPDWLMIMYVDITTFLDHDWLTDEYTRTGFLDRARVFLSELTSKDHYSLIFTNVKGFKAVNELFGDQKGDMVIYQTRNALREHFKPVIMGRIEGDHFALITEDRNITEKSLTSLSRLEFQTESIKYNYEVLCGIYKITNPKIEVSQILSGAKLAEKTLKGSNRNFLFAYYDDTMKENYVRKRYLLADFERALADNEFEPYYQPIVNAKTGKIVSAEMLIRWGHRDLGIVSPADFIPLIESEGKTIQLDKYMVHCGIDFLERRIAAGKQAVPCAINLSRVDFYDYVFIENIFRYIDEKKIEPALVRFEVTESAYTDLESTALDYLTKMKNRGINILLDDYGSGMSSLSMLETFDFDIIKLDIGFVRKIGINKKTEAIIVSTIKLAHAMGAKVTAEGVETEKQLKFLQDADCDYIQGYYFYKPLPEDEFEQLLDKK